MAGPATAPLLDTALLHKLSRLRLASRRIHGAPGEGWRRSRRRGSSIEFADYREYVHGDDFRQIDWNIYGRLGRLFLKLREDEENLGVHILVDVSRSMDWGTHNKLAYARRLAAALGYVALAGYDRLTITAFSNALHETLPPTRGRANIFRVFQFLESLRPRGETDFRRALRSYASRRGATGLAIVLSDFMAGSAFEGLQALLDKGFELWAVHLLDPTELHPDLKGDLQLIDCESDEAVDLTTDEHVLERYRQRLANWCNSLEAFCARREAFYLLVDTSIPLEDLLFHTLRPRRMLIT